MAKNVPDQKHRIFEERKRAFLLDFAKEAPQIRDSIVKDLPSFNILLALKAQSFEEFALQLLAEERGITYTKDNPLMPECPHCKTSAKVGRKEDGIYRCNICKRTFSANYNSISSGTKCDALTWMKVLQCILDSTSITKTCEYCDISETTYYKIRNRLFYAMQTLLDDLKLYGVIEADNTFVRTSYKGANLQESQFEEDSIFFDHSFKPRPARQRGGAYGFAEKNANSICIFAAIDDRGHVLTRFVGVGLTNYQALKNYIPDGKFLLSVPSKDPFSSLFKEHKREAPTKPRDKTVMVADKERAIEKYALLNGMQFESHVFRRDGVQVRLSSESHNIQRVNALHRRLKDFLHRNHYVSTKYLPGYLILFEFIENTGASQKAINKLFQILAKPNFNKHASFFEEMYTVPNYLEEWLLSDTPLSKLPYSKVLAFYLLDHQRHPEEYPEETVTMREIEEETGYSAPTIRKIYRELDAAGYREIILKHFKKPTGTHKEPQPKKPPVVGTAFTPVVLAIYDEYSEFCTIPHKHRPTITAFIEEMNKKYGTNFKRPNLMDKFKQIQASGVRSPLPPLAHAARVNGRNVPHKAFALLEEYEKTLLGYRERGETAPSRTCILGTLGEKYGLTVSTANKYIAQAKEYREKEKEKKHEKLRPRFSWKSNIHQKM